jgi:hypothetical protein
MKFLRLVVVVKTKDNVPAGTLKEKNMRKKYFFFASLKSLKKGVGSRDGSGSISQRYGSADLDPHQNVTDPQHCCNQYSV